MQKILTSGTPHGFCRWSSRSRRSEEPNITKLKMVYVCFHRQTQDFPRHLMYKQTNDVRFGHDKNSVDLVPSTEPGSSKTPKKGSFPEHPPTHVCKLGQQTHHGRPRRDWPRGLSPASQTSPRRERPIETWSIENRDVVGGGRFKRVASKAHDPFERLPGSEVGACAGWS